MRFLADMGVSPLTVQALSEQGIVNIGEIWFIFYR